jgi:NADPH:quinone reductase-like Zn-dependent oxidoreductase
VADLFPSTFPSGQGSDLAGVVEEVGARAGGFSPGNEVIGFTNRRASQAELALVEAGDLTRKPEKVSWEVAGGLFVAGATAWGAVHAVQPKEGETVVISGAAGGGWLARRPARALYRGYGHRPGEREQPRVVEGPRRGPGRVR